MKRAIAAVAAPLAISMLAAPAHASEEDTQLWIFANTVVPMGDAATASLELSPRFREGSDQLLVRGTIDFRLSESVSAGGGAAFVEFAGGDEWRAFQQLTLSTGQISFRTRVEERFFDGADRAQIRLRQRVQVSFPVAKATRLSGSAELLYIVQPESRLADARVDSWRGNLSLQRRLSPRMDAALGYLLIYSPRPGAPDRISHVPQVTITFRP